MKKSRHQHRRSRFSIHFSSNVRRKLLLSSLILVSLFVLANAVLWAAYRNRTYPGTRVMNSVIGSVPYDSLQQKIQDKKLLPEKIIMTAGDKKVEAPLSELGISLDISRSTESANKQRAWLPIRNVWKKPVLQAPIRVDEHKLQAVVANNLSKTLRQDAVNARLTLNGAAVGIEEAKNGFELNTSALQKDIVAKLDNGQSTIAVSTNTLKPGIASAQLQDARKELEAQVKTPITIAFGTKNKQASANDIAGWYVQADGLYALATDKIQAYVVQTGKDFGIRVKDLNQTVSNVQNGLQKHEAVRYTLVEQTALKTYTYCVNSRGVEASYLPTLRSKLASTFNDPRSWSLDNIIEFTEASSGCNFTVWLTEAAQMSSFGAICDSLWSCNVGSNVVINFDRWQNASPSWNANGGSLEDYRHMVINHETGHYLGFGHANCGGSGQKAPVMQQQSIDLQGCSFNPWPTSSEQATLRSRLGI